jgi:shikimate kinase
VSSGLKVILFGPPGAGKSSVGKSLARLLGDTFSDTDQIVEERAGKKISEIFVDDGEAIFRSMEAEVVLDTLARGSGVLALGGGSVMNSKVAEKIKENPALKIFLDVGIAQAAPRIGFNQDRPMLLVNPRQTWITLMKDRRPVYEGLADHTFSTDSKKAADVAQEIADLVKDGQ